MITRSAAEVFPLSSYRNLQLVYCNLLLIVKKKMYMLFA